MTKKDYKVIAIGIARRVTTSKTEKVIVYQVASSIATELEIENAKFDRKKFLIACGFETK